MLKIDHVYFLFTYFILDYIQPRRFIYFLVLVHNLVVLLPFLVIHFEDGEDVLATGLVGLHSIDEIGLGVNAQAKVFDLHHLLRVPVCEWALNDWNAWGLSFRAQLNGPVRMVAVGHVSNALGTVNPVEDIVRLAHDAGAVVLLDGAQAMAHQTIDVRKLGCDFYAFSGHKMYGPTGVGILYAKKKWLEQLPPYQGGGGMIG